jgi:hypothetical protein
MYIKKYPVHNTKKKLLFVGVLKPGQCPQEPDPEPDPELDLLVRGTDPRIQIRIKMSRICNTSYEKNVQLLPMWWHKMGQRLGSGIQ